MIEHGELKFDSKREENDAWEAMLDAIAEESGRNVLRLEKIGGNK